MTIRSCRGLAIGVAAFAISTVPVAILAAGGNQQATVRGLVGTWSCVAHSSDNKTHRSTGVASMYGEWLKVESTYPAQSGGPAHTGQAFLRYDSKNGRWIFTSVNTGGEYSTDYSDSADFNGSVWHDGYPNMHGSAVVHLTPYTRYTVDSKAPNAQGKMITEHEVCTKQ